MLSSVTSTGSSLAYELTAASALHARWKKKTKKKSSPTAREQRFHGDGGFLDARPASPAFSRMLSVAAPTSPARASVGDAESLEDLSWPMRPSPCGEHWKIRLRAAFASLGAYADAQLGLGLLARRGWQIAILTNAPQAAVEEVLRGCGLLGWTEDGPPGAGRDPDPEFGNGGSASAGCVSTSGAAAIRRVVSVHAAKAFKPSPAPYLHALGVLGVAPQVVIYACR